MVMAEGAWCLLGCPIVFVIVLLFWQDIRVCLRLRRSVVFVDKLCIDQGNEARKTAGVHHLGAFLHHARRFVVLWTPQYFTRLWCTYELACWMHLAKPLNSVVFCPLKLITALLYVMLFLLWYQVGIVAVTLLGGSGNVVFFVLQLSLGAVFCTVGAHVLRHELHDLCHLPSQLKQFSIASSQCFCCTVGHVMPGTKRPLPCDRKMINNTVQRWFSDPGSTSPGQEEGLDHFNEAVRSELGPYVMTSAWMTAVSYWTIVIMLSPLGWRACALLASWNTTTPPMHIMRQLAIFLTYIFAVGPLCVKIAMYLLVCMEVRIGMPAKRRLDFAASLLISSGMFFLHVLCYYPLQLSFMYMHNPLMQWLYTVFLVVLTMWVYGAFSAISRRIQSTTAAQTAESPVSNIPAAAGGEELEFQGGFSL